MFSDYNNTVYGVIKVKHQDATPDTCIPYKI